jgi:hypothetical protein
LSAIIIKYFALSSLGNPHMHTSGKALYYGRDQRILVDGVYLEIMGKYFRVYLATEGDKTVRREK